VLAEGGMSRTDELRARISTALGADIVEVQDDSAQHRGHAGASGGAGHYTVVVVAGRFAGMGRLDRHRAVYAAVGGMIPREVHALVVRAFTPEEWQKADASS
jgi:BolA family transcriptional regulator, general stress-responsive regulator